MVEEDDDDGNCFAFRHALTREAVYAELLRAETRELHARVAVALASEPTLDVAAIAEHTYRARDAEHAVAWNERAGDGARPPSRTATRRATTSARTSSRATRRSSGDLAEKVADAWYATGDVERSADWLVRAMDRISPSATACARRAWRSATPGCCGSWASTRTASRPTASGRRPAAARRGRRCASRPRRRWPDCSTRWSARPRRSSTWPSPSRCSSTPTSTGSTRFHGIYGYCLGLLGRGAEARDRFDTTVALAREHGEDDVLLRTLNNRGNFELKTGTVAAARAFYDEALAVAERTKNLRIVPGSRRTPRWRRWSAATSRRRSATSRAPNRSSTGCRSSTATSARSRCASRC